MNSMDVTNMVWRPGLIKLTQIANPDHDDGKPTDIYVDPGCIQYIRRISGSFRTIEGLLHNVVEYHPTQDCTVVNLHGQTDLIVMETPAEIRSLRDEAFGQGAPNKPLKAV